MCGGGGGVPWSEEMMVICFDEAVLKQLFLKCQV